MRESWHVWPRPVQRLIPLEVNDREEDHSTHSETGGETCTESETPSQTHSIMIDSTSNVQPPRIERLLLLIYYS